MNEFIEKNSYVLENLNKYKCHSYILGIYWVTNNLNDNALNGILTTDISDHFSVFHISKAHDVICANGNIDNQLYKRVISEYNIKRFTSAIQATNWKFIYVCSNPNDAYMYNKFIETYNNILNTNMPLKKFKIKRSTNEKPWLTNENYT